MAAKRQRLDESGAAAVTEKLGEGRGPMQNRRDAALSTFAEYSAPASACVSLAVGSDDFKFSPLFVHQQFDCERVFGYRRPQITIRYTDPELRMHVEATALEVLSAKDVAGNTGPLLVDDLAQCLHKSLPDDFPETMLKFTLSSDIGVAAQPDLSAYFPAPNTTARQKWTPPGPSVARYATQAGLNFSINRWSLGSEEARAYHDRMQTLSMWLIDAASPIDCDDPAWTVYGLYEEASDQQLRFAGYATTYAFVAPMRKPRPNSVRLAQLLLLPRYQRQGHGLRLMDAIYRDASSAAESCPLATLPSSAGPGASPYGGTVLTWGGPWLGGDVHEVTVEAPCEGMSRLRDAHDVARAASARVFDGVSEAWGTHRWATHPLSDAGFSSSAASSSPSSISAALPVRDLTPKEMEPFRSVLRCTLPQAYRAYEALLLASLLSPLPPSDGSATVGPGDDSVKAYRLMVKRRLLAHDEDLKAIADVETRKALLEDAFQACWAHYLAALAAVRPAPLVPPAVSAAAQAAFRAREAEREKQLEAQATAAAEA